MTNNIKPERNKIYSYKEIVEILSLEDAPYLRMFIDDSYQSVQDSHVSEEEMLSIEGWPESQWRYMHTTHEWVPIFNYVGEDFKHLVDVEDYIDPYPDSEFKESKWITPKNFPRPQPYKSKLDF